MNQRRYTSSTARWLGRVLVLAVLLSLPADALQAQSAQPEGY